MKIVKHHSLILADKVLVHLRKELANKPGDNIVVGCWSNCREQGYHLSGSRIFGSCNRLCVNIAECRGSDQVIVQFGTSDDFDGQTHHCSNDAIYEQQKYFDEPEAAAKFIAEFFISSPLRRMPASDLAAQR